MFSRLEIVIHQFAKRQMTWFRGMERRGFDIHWIDAMLPLSDKVEQILDDDKPITASAAKNLGDAIKSIKDTQMIRTPEDIEEQKARIEKLRKESAAEDFGRGVSIEIKGWEEEWAK